VEPNLLLGKVEQNIFDCISKNEAKYFRKSTFKKGGAKYTLGNQPLRKVDFLKVDIYIWQADQEKLG
jgi:hypothetical protein